MKFNSLPVNGAFIIEPEPFKDTRGQFARIFCKEEFKDIRFSEEIAQINHSINVKKGALRGMHYQNPPQAETRIVKCIRGKVFDVIIDVRKNSSTFLIWHGEILSAENVRMMYIPKGFAHGFQVLDPNSELIYFHSGYYDPSLEAAIRYCDPKIGIKWPLNVSEISEKDASHPLIDNDFEGISI
jgi:dTDP-4-dehydrorhamnose 3,5-epimerase